MNKNYKCEPNYFAQIRICSCFLPSAASGSGSDGSSSGSSVYGSGIHTAVAIAAAAVTAVAAAWGSDGRKEEGTYPKFQFLKMPQWFRSHLSRSCGLTVHRMHHPKTKPGSRALCPHKPMRPPFLWHTGSSLSKATLRHRSRSPLHGYMGNI